MSECDLLHREAGRLPRRSEMTSVPQTIVIEAAGPVWIRTATAADLDALSSYFQELSPPAQYNRFMGAVSNFSRIAFDCLKNAGSAEFFTLLAESREAGGDRIVGEASYGFDRAQGSGEFAISVAEQWRQRGLGSALLHALQSRAVSLGHFELFGETLRSNQEMKCMARSAGFAFSRSLDWRAIRFDKRLVVAAE
jgi:L-amino acid N-acyltransferase YncA